MNSTIRLSAKDNPNLKGSIMDSVNETNGQLKKWIQLFRLSAEDNPNLKGPSLNSVNQAKG